MTLLKSTEKKIENILPVAWEGLPFIGAGLLLTLVFLCFQWFFLSAILFLFTLFAGNFFRDPERKGGRDGKTIITPADGKLIGIHHLEHDQNPLGKPAVKLSIFMNIFNVHVNRIPTNGVVEQIQYVPGKFFSANLDKASEKNERNSITLLTEDGQKIIFIQIAGLIARRIACWVKEGQPVRSGQRFGLIRFGSRLDVYLPEGAQIIARLDDRVRAGETVLGVLP